MRIRPSPKGRWRNRRAGVWTSGCAEPHPPLLIRQLTIRFWDASSYFAIEFSPDLNNRNWLNERGGISRWKGWLLFAIARATMTGNANNAIERLTQGQIDCLLLVHQHLTSKEIGPRLGISSHTVDQRIRGALRILGCKRRSQAATLVVSTQDKERFLLLQREVAEPFVEPQTKLPDGKSRRSIRLPFATPVHPNNEMSISVRLFWIVAIASGSAFSAGLYLAGLESVSGP